MSNSPYPPIPEDLLLFIKQGERTTVEFKKSTKEITKNVYHTVCAFSNRSREDIFFFG